MTDPVWLEFEQSGNFSRVWHLSQVNCKTDPFTSKLGKPWKKWHQVTNSCVPRKIKTDNKARIAGAQPFEKIQRVLHVLESPAIDGQNQLGSEALRRGGQLLQYCPAVRLPGHPALHLAGSAAQLKISHSVQGELSQRGSRCQGHRLGVVGDSLDDPEHSEGVVEGSLVPTLDQGVTVFRHHLLGPPCSVQLQKLLHSGWAEGAIEVGVQLHLRQRLAELEGGRLAHVPVDPVEQRRQGQACPSRAKVAV